MGGRLQALVIACALTGLWVVVTVGAFTALQAAYPVWSAPQASLGALCVATAGLILAVSLKGWWRDVGVNSRSEWRDIKWLAVPAVLTLLPLAAGVQPVDASATLFLAVAYLLTGFAEETMFRGVLLKILGSRGLIASVVIASVLFGLAHLGNIVIRGNAPVIFAQAVGAACFGFGYAATRLRTNTIVPLMLTHMFTDLFLQLGTLPLIPVAVAQDVVLLGYGIYLLRGFAPTSAEGTRGARASA
ncbi:MAG TPA: CPBP family intramembrane glutamic endopeptidase [Devosiaceae bacterium]